MAEKETAANSAFGLASLLEHFTFSPCLLFDNSVTCKVLESSQLSVFQSADETASDKIKLWRWPITMASSWLCLCILGTCTYGQVKVA